MFKYIIAAPEMWIWNVGKWVCGDVFATDRSEEHLQTFSNLYLHASRKLYTSWFSTALLLCLHVKIFKQKRYENMNCDVYRL